MISRRGTKITTPQVCFPGCGWTICHIISAATQESTRVFFSSTRRCFKAKRGAVRDRQPGHTCGDVAQNVAASPLLRFPLMDTAFPRCSMHRPAVSFPLPAEAEFRLAEIQPRPGLETETVWRMWAQQEPQEPVVHARGRCCALRTVTKQPGNFSEYLAAKSWGLGVYFWAEVGKLIFMTRVISIAA